MKIKASDNQVLQKINESNCQIEDMIENLKNDSSLRFYHQRAIFCYNGNYGYINSQYKIAIEPIYSYAENFTNGLALVKKVFPDGEKAIIIDVDGNIYLDRWYEYIGGSEKTVLLKSEIIFYVFSKEDNSIINQYIDAKYDGKSELIPVHKHIGVDDMYGFIDKTGSEVIPFIYDYVWNFEGSGFARVKRFGFLYIIDTEGTLYRTTKQTEIKESCTIIKEDTYNMGFSFEPIPANEYWTKLIDNKWCIVSSKVEMFFDESGNYTGDYEYNKNEYTIVYKFDRIFYFDGEYATGRVDDKCVLVKFIPTIEEMVFEVDRLIPNVYYEGWTNILNLVAFKNGKYGVLDLKKKNTVPFEYDDIELCSHKDYEQVHFAIVMRNERFSIIDTTTGKIKTPLSYNSIILNDCHHIRRETICFFAKIDDHSYSCLNYRGEEIIEIACDHFKYECVFTSYEEDYSSKQILYLEKSEKKGICIICHPDDGFKFYRKLNNIETLYIEPVYDECVLCNSKSQYAVFPTMGLPYVAVRLGTKWGIIDGSMFHNYNLIDDSWYLFTEPNYGDLEFKYDSLSELEKDANSEFLRRYEKNVNYDE